MFLLLFACKEPDASAPSSGSLQVLSYNVHGLPPTITGDDTPGRMRQIAPLLTAYDLLGLQESWDDANDALLTANLTLPTQDRFNTPLEGRAYGAGLSAWARPTALSIADQNYETCFGTVDNASDCFASKGFQRLRLDFGEGAVLDFYNTHLEAGSGDEDNVSRAAQVEMLVTAMNEDSADKAVLFVGDTNLDDGPVDGPVVESWQQRTGLRSACAAVDCPEPGRIDRLMIRDGGGLRLTVDFWAVEADFVDDAGTPLSDHEAITIGLAWERDP